MAYCMFRRNSKQDIEAAETVAMSIHQTLREALSSKRIKLIKHFPDVFTKHY